jgi:hypothetical protein
MTEAQNKHGTQLIELIQIQNSLVNDFDFFDPRTKELLVNNGLYWLDRLNNEHFSMTQLKSITNDFLILWRESVGVAVELFWVEVKKHSIDFERKDELVFALQNGRFRNVFVGMGARKDWGLIQNFDSIKARFSKDEIHRISEIIALDEENRVNILKKCLKKKEIPRSKYLKFGECMAYIHDCELWENFFTKNEVDDLHEIWNSYK